jgi:hypothetical protein
VKTIAGAPKIDTIFLGEVHIDLLGAETSMRVVVGYQDSKSGRRMGSTTKLANWSPETIQKLREFLEAVENDAASELFDTGTTGGGVDAGLATTDGIPQL